MGYKNFLTGVIYLFSFLSFSIALAQEKEVELDPVTITSSLFNQRASTTGRNIFIIKGETFSSLPVHSIDELLRYVPGIEVQARGPMGAQSDFVIRGGTFQQVLVLLDGVRLNDPNTGHFSSYIPIAPAEIDRIEVLKGASSSIYGSDAVGGVIHIITKTYSVNAATKKSNALLQLTGGEYNLFSANAGGFITNGITSFGAGLLTNNTKGQLQRGTRGFVNAHTASASLSHKFSNRFQSAFRTAYDDRDFSAQNFYTTFISDTSKERVKTFWNQLQLALNTNDNNRLKLDIGYKKLNDRFAFNKASAPNESKSELFQALLSDEWKANDNTIITSGLQFIDKKIESNDRGNHSVKQSAAFVVLNQTINENFILNPSARVEWNERAGWEVIPQLNVSYRLSPLQLRGSIGKTIRDADFTERFNNYNKTFVASGRIGNPALEAERSLSYEAGVDFFAVPSLKISGTFFQRNHSNLIDYVVTPYTQMPRKENLSPTGTYALAKNISKITTTGIETDVQFVKEISSNKRLWTSFGATWLKSLSDNATPSFYISSHAKYLLNFNLVYTQNWLSFSTNGIYKKRNPQTATAGIAPVSSDYFLLNAKAEAFYWKNKGSVFIEVDNLLNTIYADLLGSQMPGRWLMGGIKISLSK